MYADDMAIFGDTNDQTKNVFGHLDVNASKIGLKINVKKMNVLHAGYDYQLRPVTMLMGSALEICNEFLYLGVSTRMFKTW